MERLLKTFDQYHDELGQMRYLLNRSGVMCPEEGCGGELLYADFRGVLCSYPAKKVVECEKCKKRTYLEQL